MPLSRNDPDLLTRFDQVARHCIARVENDGARWTITIQRGHGPLIQCAAVTITAAVADGVAQAESLGWHRPDPR